MDSHIPEQQVIIDKETGRTLDENGYLSKNSNDNKLNISLDYSSGLPHPYISVKLYRRDYNRPDDLTYSLVDLHDYVSESIDLIAVGDDDPNNDAIYPNEYEALSISEIQDVVDELEDDTQTATFNLDYTLNEDLTTGTYKVVFTLYDRTDYQEPEYVKDETTGEFVPTGNMLNKVSFEYIGETFSYIIIK